MPLDVEAFSAGHPKVDEKIEQFVRAAWAEVIANAGAVTAAVQHLCPEFATPTYKAPPAQYQRGAS